jgi:UDP-N-acetylmuramyl pentapeptide synthase
MRCKDREDRLFYKTRQGCEVNEVPRVPLSELIQLLPEVRLAGASDVRVWVTDVAYDSRKVEPGALFVAIPGQRYDGHDFVTDAVARGAVAVVVERP